MDTEITIARMRMKIRALEKARDDYKAMSAACERLLEICQEMASDSRVGLSFTLNRCPARRPNDLSAH